MITLENIETIGFEHAVRGMRNPMNSWDRGDSVFTGESFCYDCGRPHEISIECQIGDNDLTLMKKLAKAGTDHRKYLRMINVYMDITAPLYWWKEYDTYKVGTVANSCSTMHKIHEKEFTLEDFSHEHIIMDQELNCFADLTPFNEDIPIEFLKATLRMLNMCRKLYLETKDKRYWWQMIQLLPSSYNQKRTVVLNYEVLANMYHSRKNHKLDEWREFCAEVERLPYFKAIVIDNM